MNHDGTDPLRLKGDKLIWISAALFTLVVILPTIYILLKFLFWLCAYSIVIEVDEKEWTDLKKKGKVEWFSDNLL